MHAYATATPGRPSARERSRAHAPAGPRAGAAALAPLIGNRAFARMVARERGAAAKNHDSPSRPKGDVAVEDVTGKNDPPEADRLAAALWADDERLQRAYHNSPSLKPNDGTEPVKKLQAALVTAGLPMPGSTKQDGTMDGVWGKETTATVHAFQVREGIQPPGGWEAGHKTLGRLDTLLAPGPGPGPGPKPAPPPAPACAAGNEAKQMKACLQPFVIADDDGKNPTTASSLDAAVNIWKKCCIDYKVKPVKTIKKTAFKTLDESKDDKATKEEKKLFDKAGSSDCIQVFFPTEFKQDGATGKKISGGGATYDSGKKHPKIVCVEDAKPEVVAHEIGHASGHDTHDVNDTVMKPTGAHDVANSSAVSSDVCTKARKGKVLTGTGKKKGCCMDPK